MFDQWKAKRKSEVDVFDVTYRPTDAITEKAVLNPGLERLVVMFPPWHNGDPHYSNLARRIAEQNTVLKYQFHDSIIEPDPQRVLQSHEFVENVVAEDIAALQEELGITRVHLLGISVGNVALTRVAAKLDEFESATIALGASDLAASMWEGIRTQGIRSGFEDKGVRKEELVEKWQPLAPINHAQHFRGKDVRTVISRRDTIMGTHYQRQLTRGLQANGARVTTQYVSTGHYLSVWRFCEFQGRLLKGRI